MSPRRFTHSIGYEYISLDAAACHCPMFYFRCAETTSDELRHWLMQPVIGQRRLANACMSWAMSPSQCAHTTWDSSMPYMMLLSIVRCRQINARRSRLVSSSQCTHTWMMHAGCCCMSLAYIACSMCAGPDALRRWLNSPPWCIQPTPDNYWVMCTSQDQSKLSLTTVDEVMCTSHDQWWTSMTNVSWLIPHSVDQKV